MAFQYAGWLLAKGPADPYVGQTNRRTCHDLHPARVDGNIVHHSLVIAVHAYI